MNVYRASRSNPVRCLWLTDTGQRVGQWLPAGLYTRGKDVPITVDGVVVVGHELVAMRTVRRASGSRSHEPLPRVYVVSPYYFAQLELTS